MPQIFHRSANTISRLSIFGAVFFVAALLGLFDEVNRSPWVTEAHVPREPHQWGELRHLIFKANAELEWFDKYALGRTYVWETAPAPAD